MQTRAPGPEHTATVSYQSRLDGLWMPAALQLCSSVARRRGGWGARRSDRVGCRQVDIQKLWVFISSLILGSAFVFGNSLKQLYESVFFLFMVHPFDVGAPWPPGPASLTGHLRQSSGSWR